MNHSDKKNCILFNDISAIPRSTFVFVLDGGVSKNA